MIKLRLFLLLFSITFVCQTLEPTFAQSPIVSPFEKRMNDGKSQYGRKQYKISLATFKGILRDYPRQKSTVQPWIDKCNARLTEAAEAAEQRRREEVARRERETAEQRRREEATRREQEAAKQRRREEVARREREAAEQRRREEATRREQEAAEQRRREEAIRQEQERMEAARRERERLEAARPIVEQILANMVYVEGGTFSMGSSEYYNSYENVRPAHIVTLNSFYICKYEVTQAQWQAVMGGNPSEDVSEDLPVKRGDLPVDRVSWNDCQEFIRRLNVITGKNFRLPTEAEWEYAARGGKNSKGTMYAGSSSIGKVAWYYDNSYTKWSDYYISKLDNEPSMLRQCKAENKARKRQKRAAEERGFQFHGSYTREVGTKNANELGLYDMSGNVWELCSDWFGAYNASEQNNPIGPLTGEYKVIRGGGCSSPSYSCKVLTRFQVLQNDNQVNVGLRLAF